MLDVPLGSEHAADTIIHNITKDEYNLLFCWKKQQQQNCDKSIFCFLKKWICPNFVVAVVST